MTTKKILLFLLTLWSMCGATIAQTPYKVLEVYKNGKVTHTHQLSDIDSFTVRTWGETPDTPILPDLVSTHEYVDLGLPSGTLWATCNVGATSPYDYGDYFAWGETMPKGKYNWSTYKWCEGLDSTLTKYCTSSDYGTVDNKTVLEASDDAATANWGSDWRMPTYAEQEELCDTNYCTWTWTTRINSAGTIIYGDEVKSKSNGNSIFLPHAGFCYNTWLYDSGTQGCYRSSMLCFNYPNSAYILSIYPGKQDWKYSYNHFYGFSVRPVRTTVGKMPYKILEVYKDGKVTHTHKLSDIDSLVMRTLGETPNTPVGPGDDTHEYVDLGLPSGTLWATTNVGANSPADYGDYFTWGDPTPVVYGVNIAWSNYKWYNESVKLTKYNTTSSTGRVDNKTQLEASDDAATVNWGSAWRIPTFEEQQELSNTDYCTWTWTTRTNSAGKTINGYEVKSKFNGNSIFLPAAGIRSCTTLSDLGLIGDYWSSSLYSSRSNSAYNLEFGATYRRWFDFARYSGMSVRPVRTTTLK